MHTKFSPPPVDHKALQLVVENSLRRHLSRMLESATASDSLLDVVTDDVVDWLDKQIKYPGAIGRIVDSVDHIVLKMVVKLLVRPLIEKHLNNLVG